MRGGATHVGFNPVGQVANVAQAMPVRARPVQKQLACGTKPIWAGLTVASVFFMFIGALVFLSGIGAPERCKRAACDLDTAACPWNHFCDYSDGSHGHCTECHLHCQSSGLSGLGSSECEKHCNQFAVEYKTDCETRAGAHRTRIGFLLVTASIICISIFPCGICVCCCFEGRNAVPSPLSQIQMASLHPTIHHPVDDPPVQSTGIPVVQATFVNSHAI